MPPRGASPSHPLRNIQALIHSDDTFNTYPENTFYPHAVMMPIVSPVCDVYLSLSMSPTVPGTAKSKRHTNRLKHRNTKWEMHHLPNVFDLPTPYSDAASPVLRLQPFKPYLLHATPQQIDTPPPVLGQPRCGLGKAFLLKGSRASKVLALSYNSPAHTCYPMYPTSPRKLIIFRP